MVPVAHNRQWKTLPSKNLRRTVPVKGQVESLRCFRWPGHTFSDSNKTTSDGLG